MASTHSKDEERLFSKRSPWSNLDGVGSARSVLERLGIEERAACCVVMMGSRLWGTAHAESDFDVVVVLRDEHAKGREPRQCRHSGAYDAVVMTQRAFAERLEEGRLYEHVAFYLASLKSGLGGEEEKEEEEEDIELAFYRQFVLLLSDGKQALLGKSHAGWRFSAERVGARAQKTVGRDWRVAEKHVGKGEAARGKKIVVHALRTLLLAMLLIRDHSARAAERGKGERGKGERAKGREKGEKGAVVDLARGVQLHHRMAREHAFTKEWAAIDAAFAPVRDRLLAELQALIA